MDKKIEMTAIEEQNKISIYDSLKAVDLWLNSEDVNITDKDGNPLKDFKITCKPGSLLSRMIPFLTKDS